MTTCSSLARGTTGHPRKWCIPTNRCIRRPVPGHSTIDVRYRDRLLLPLRCSRGGVDDSLQRHARRHADLVLRFDATKVVLIVEERVCIGGAVPAILSFMPGARSSPNSTATSATPSSPVARAHAGALIDLYRQEHRGRAGFCALNPGGALRSSEDALRKAGSADAPPCSPALAVRGDGAA